MCGITGKLYFDPLKKVEVNELKNMTHTIFHRGPDDEGYYVKDNIGLGFRRLSIIDLKGGHQPLSNVDKSIWITFNGEIYNYQELRNNLTKKGYAFNTKTDTEVIVKLYEEYGESCVNYLRGMFAFVIWDDNKKQLFGARDRIGIKPFYYYVDDNEFIWGSELKTIKASGNLDLNINLKGVDQYLSYGYLLNSSSIFNEIKKIEPGVSFTINPFKGKKIEFKKYWELRFEPDHTKSEDEWVELLKEELAKSVEMRMISDVPLGAFLSGGIDSSSVVALMSSMSKQPIKTFSIGFKEQEFNELQYANIIAKKYNTDHHEMIIEPESVDLLPKLVKAYDEPFADSSAIPTYYVSKFTREHVTVALSGDGGDELFAGYNSYRKMLKLHQRPFNNNFVNQTVSLAHKLMPDYLELKKWSYYFTINSENIGALLGVFKPYERNKLYKSDIKQKLSDYQSEKEKIELLKKYKSDFISNNQLLDINTYMVDDILTKVDRASMMNSLEVRVPLLDHKVVELASRIPSNFKINNDGKKMILKKAMQDYLPDKIVSHKKQGFGVPLSMWFRDDLKEYINDTLLSNSAKINNYFNNKELTKMVNNHHKGLRDYSSKLWSILFFEEWLQQNL